MSSIVFGIDFGTTNSCISYFDGTNYHIITNDYGNYTTPTCIYFSKISDEITFGETALSQSHRNGTLITNIKRLLGITYNQYKQNTDLQSFFKNLHVTKDKNTNYCNITLQYNNEIVSFSIEHLVETYINWLIKVGQDNTKEERVNINSKSIVVTVPVEFDHNKRNIMKSCLENIGFKNIKIINEPTAATLAYIYEYKQIKQHTTDENNENILVVDCGGGTCDFTVLETDYTDMYFEVLENIGEPFLGGEDLTNNLMTRVLQRINTNNEKIELSTKITRYLRNACELTKRNLTYRNADIITLENINDKDYNITITRAEFEMCNKTWFDKLQAIITNISEDYTIHKVIFVGGTTVTPKIKTIIETTFPDVNIYNNINPDYTVSVGAAIQAYLLYKDRGTDPNLDITFVDSLSMTLGVETTGGFMTPIISKNTMLPCSRTETFVTVDEENTIDINVYQGERRFVKDNSFLGTFTIERSNKTKSKVIITFDITSDGLLIVTAQLNESCESGASDIEKSVVLHFNKNVDDAYCYTDDFDKIDDTDLANLITAKIELNNTFQTTKSMAESTRLIKNPEYQTLIDQTQEIIDNYTRYDSNYLQSYKTQFQQTWWTLHNKYISK